MHPPSLVCPLHGEGVEPRRTSDVRKYIRTCIPKQSRRQMWRFLPPSHAVRTTCLIQHRDPSWRIGCHRPTYTYLRVHDPNSLSSTQETNRLKLPDQSRQCNPSQNHTASLSSYSLSDSNNRINYMCSD